MLHSGVLYRNSEDHRELIVAIKPHGTAVALTGPLSTISDILADQERKNEGRSPIAFFQVAAIQQPTISRNQICAGR